MVMLINLTGKGKRAKLLLTMVSSVRSAFSSDSCLSAADLKKAEAIEGLKLNTDGCGDKLRSCGC